MISAKRIQGLLAFSVILTGAACAFGAEDVSAPQSLPRFIQVAPGVYRGGQPKPAGYEWLKQHGVKTIINLRREHDERKQIESFGFNYVYLPMGPTDEISPSTIQMFLATVSDPARQPVFIHCRRGADRTGFMVGIFRVSQQGWSAEKAYDEAREVGMRWWYRGLKRQLYEFAEKLRSVQSAAAGN